MNNLQTLKKARAIIASRENWVQGSWSEHGRHCAVGALQKAMGLPCGPPSQNGTESALAPVVRQLARAIGEPYSAAPARSKVQTYNDSHPHECVVAMFDAAIEVEEKKETK